MNNENPTQERLRVTEIFYSIQGESASVGMPTVFIRLTGCPLRCVYCDTEYAFQGGSWMSLAEILQQVKVHNSRFVTVTGGEPMAQPGCVLLLKQLCDAGYIVSLETSGALALTHVDKRVIKVMDIKTPDSGEEQKNMLSNIDLLEKKDQVKFVLCGHSDYEWAKGMIARYKLLDRCEIIFSPSYGKLAISDLAQWILEDQLCVRLQTQLHKLIWGNEPGR